MKKIVALFLCAAVLASLCGCRINISAGVDSRFTGDEYPDAEKYRTGAFTYRADEVSAIEVYWRSGRVEITEAEYSEFSVKESGEDLPESVAMHWLLEDGVLRIRFCASGADVSVKSSDKQLYLSVPKGKELSVRASSATVSTGALDQKSVHIYAHSGSTELGRVTAESIELQSSSGAVRANSISARTFACNTSSGSVTLVAVSAEKFECKTSSGSVSVGGIRAEQASVATSSGSVKLAIAGLPDTTVRTSSGKVTVTLPAGGARVTYDSGSGKLRTRLDYEKSGDIYIFGSEECRLTVGTSSGDLEIR